MLYERKLIDYLPHILRDVREYKTILNDGEESEVSDLWGCLENALNDQFIQDATENGIARWERILNITPKANWTLDERRFEVLTKVNEQIPFTITSLKDHLNALCGEDGYSVELDAKTFTLYVEIALAEQNKYNAVVTLLNRIVPANMVIDVSIKYNKNYLLERWTHQGLTAYTHEELRSDTSITI